MKAEHYQEQRLTLPTNFIPGKVGIVTVLYNSDLVLPDFFDSINKQTYNNFSVYCVDNASTDNSVAQCQAQGSRYILILNSHNYGVAGGNNQGIRAAIADGCELILLINNDVVFGTELLRQLIDGLNAHQCTMTTPLMYYHNRPNVIWAAGGYFQWYFGYRCLHYGDGDADQGQYTHSTQVQYTPTCCVLLRRQAFSTIGMMDERYFAYYDDTDFMLRARQQGEALYLLPHAKLWHKVSSLTGTDSPFRTRYVHRNHALYGHKHLPLPFAYLISFVYCAGYFLLSIVGKISFSEASERIRYWREGIRAAYISHAT